MTLMGNPLRPKGADLWLFEGVENPYKQPLESMHHLMGNRILG